MTELKNKLQPQHMWTRTAEGEGLYVAGEYMKRSLYVIDFSTGVYVEDFSVGYFN